MKHSKPPLLSFVRLAILGDLLDFLKKKRVVRSLEYIYGLAFLQVTYGHQYHNSQDYNFHQLFRYFVEDLIK